MTVDIRVGDALAVLKDMPDESVHCVISSPPYWGLRAYKGDHGMIGLEETFDEHLENLVAVFREVRRVLRSDGTLWLNYGDAYCGGGRGNYGNGQKQKTNAGSLVPAIRGWVHSGRKPKDLMMMPARVAMALQDDGWFLRSEIVWHKPNPMPESCTDRPTMAHEKLFLMSKSGDPLYWTHNTLPGVRLKPEPDYFWRNRKTEEETDDEPADWRTRTFMRDGKAVKLWQRVNRWVGHDYFYDTEAVRSPMQPQSVARLNQSTFDTQTGGPKDPKSGNRSHRKVLENLHRRQPAGWATSDSYKGQDARYADRRGQGRTRGLPPRHEKYESSDRVTLDDVARSMGANLRNVWTIPEDEYAQFLQWKAEREGALTDAWKIATHSYREAHFATFPPALVEPCIKAGTSEKGVCAECGAPWERVVDKSYDNPGNRTTNGDRSLEQRHETAGFAQRLEARTETTGWRPTCGCYCDQDGVWGHHDPLPKPATVLDPFGGSGTVGLVADRLQRAAILIEISPDYAEMARRRIEGDAPLFAPTQRKEATPCESSSTSTAPLPTTSTASTS